MWQNHRYYLANVQASVNSNLFLLNILIPFTKMSLMRDAGIHSNMYRWITNILTDKESYQSKECLKEGILQGRVLFTLYINDIVKYLPDTCRAYSAQAHVNGSVHMFPGTHVPRTYVPRFAVNESSSPPRLILLSLQIDMIILIFALVVRVSVRQRPAQFG